ncbi:DUF3574 domain-containing protein [Pseudoxanthomonas sp. 10H]|uniref:DUF3574 domain-containing protein n=1 Tax=Pseudoxanthomonas sp. 10H TaxID=3242729 RepID=UPI003557AD2A
MTPRLLHLSPLLVLLLAACASAPPHAAGAHAPPRAAATPVPATRWVRSELYFGATPAADADAAALAVDAARWRAFLDAEVTPRFPDGLTVFEAYGQWRHRDAPAPERQRARVLVILHEDTPRRRADIEAIRSAWKRATGHESVLWSLQPAEVSF